MGKQHKWNPEEHSVTPIAETPAAPTATVPETKPEEVVNPSVGVLVVPGVETPK